MKQIIACIAVLFLFSSCKNEKKQIVSPEFIDSVISNYGQPAIYKSINTDLEFWKNRIDPKNPGLVNELKYASMLLQRFYLSGDINDVIMADSILFVIDRTYAHKESSPNIVLLRTSILQHRFKEADSLLLQVRKNNDVKPYDAIVSSFDVAFELGFYKLAEAELKKIADLKDYGYNFRYAKLAHYKGELDSAIAAMHRAANIGGRNVYFKQAALSNEADLHLHKGDLRKANDIYMQSIRLNVTDLHSIMRLGWIALVHDKNDSLAERIFHFVQSKTKSPEPLFKLYQLTDARGDSAAKKKYATEFEAIVSQSVYGNMYNKYLIELYTGILNDPAKAETIAAKELYNRATPQTYAWYVWTLYCNNKPVEAEKAYQEHVSGQPLEGLELYWMGKYMQAQNKGYNAKQFFKAAYKNRYDLNPSMVKDLENEL